MVSERQIAANRANAKRSTGSKTLAGKMKSRRDTLRHGASPAPKCQTWASALFEIY